MSKAVAVSWDWKEQPLGEDGGGVLGDALKTFGLHIYPRPSDEGSDQYGFVISDKPLTPKEINEADHA